MIYVKFNKSIHSKLKILVLFVAVLFSSTLFAQQVSVTSGKGVVYPQYENRIDFLVMMYDITANSEISITLPDPTLSVNWYRYPDLQFVSNQKSISPDDHTGYLAKITGTVNGQPYNNEWSVWIIDYKLYQPVFNSLTIPDPQTSVCNQLNLTLDAVIPEMYYLTTNGLKNVLDRNFTLQYETLEWNDGWTTKQIEKQLVVEDNIIEIDEPPYKDTYFTLTGDQFASDLNIVLPTIQSPIYQAIRVVSKVKTEATIRVEKQEGDRPESITTVSGSAPLEINFSAISNTPVANYFRWEISTGGAPAFIVKTGENQRYTFNEAGTFTVKLITENTYCSHIDSVVIKVSESAIYAPNVFTPNGDGFNDEFRVAYKSIIGFDCWIFNRWGSKIYHWSDPQKGWDGTHKGKAVPEGAYFYVIKAKGADGINYNLKGDINLLRGKKQ
ncbi:MAG: gliding motility-associated C-terminal domain-containing protein [Paludibacter sp.]|nr:gliding motility-associated C-terminal domain-containing protein [Paludibacter sp.]